MTPRPGSVAGGSLTRRHVLTLPAVLGLAGAGLLSACGTADEKRVSFLNWQDYVDPALLDDFSDRSGLAVGYETYESNDALARRLAAADVTRKAGRKTTTFDLVVPSDNLFRRLREADGLQELDGDVVTSALLDNLGPEMTSLAVDPGNRFAVPWATGTTGIAYDTEVFAEPPTWEVFLDATHQGRMSVLDETREAFAAALFSLGEDPNTRDASVVDAAADRLREMSANTAFDASTYLDKLAGGDLVAAQAFSTDALQARKRNPRIAFVVPDAGGTRWVDLLCVPADAPNPEGANQLVAFYLDPKVSAANAAFNLVDTGNEAAREFVPQDVLDDPAVYPPDDVVSRLTFLQDLGDDEDLYTRAWEDLRG